MKKHLLWILELLIWGLLIFSAIFVSLYIYNYNVRAKHTYYVFFNDVDGIIKGSPVKVQGFQVGYVSDISIVDEDVFITFIITDKDFVMPQNLTATVEFTGMGGSKSLELSVPESGTSTKNYIKPVEPKRLQDFYVYQTQIAQNIVSMTTDFMNIMTPKNTNTVVNFIKDPMILEQIHNILDIVQTKETNMINNRSKDEKHNVK